MRDDKVFLFELSDATIAEVNKVYRKYVSKYELDLAPSIFMHMWQSLFNARCNFAIANYLLPDGEAAETTYYQTIVDDILTDGLVECDDIALELYNAIEATHARGGRLPYVQKAIYQYVTFSNDTYGIASLEALYVIAFELIPKVTDFMEFLYELKHDFEDLLLFNGGTPTVLFESRLLQLSIALDVYIDNCKKMDSGYA